MFKVQWFKEREMRSFACIEDFDSNDAPVFCVVVLLNFRQHFLAEKIQLPRIRIGQADDQRIEAAS